MELVSSDGVPVSKERISSEETLRTTAAAMSVFFARVLVIAASGVIDSVLVSVSVLGLVFVSFNVLFKDDFLALTQAWPDERDTISLMSCIG